MVIFSAQQSINYIKCACVSRRKAADKGEKAPPAPKTEEPCNVSLLMFVCVWGWGVVVVLL